MQYDSRLNEKVIKIFNYKSVIGIQKALDRLANKLYGQGNFVYVFEQNLIGGYVRTNNNEFCLEAVMV